jgi:hypothetical protein
LHLALNGHKTSSTGKRDPREHREWIEDLVNLLFQVKNDNFGEEITSKPYPKYVYQSVSKGPKPAEKEAFLKAINNISSHLYSENPSKKRGYCFFYVKISYSKSSNSTKSEDSLSYLLLMLNKEDNSVISEKKRLNQERYQRKRVKWWCQECNKFIYKECWNLYH